MKMCAACKKELPIENFSKDNTRKNGIKSYCKTCNKERVKIYASNNREKRHQYNKENKEQIKEYNKDYYGKNKDNFQNNYKYYLKNNPQFRIAHNTRVRINKAIKHNYKNSSSKELLGCEIDFYKEYLEKQFKPDMNWNNYGLLWDIDHVRPCATFDLSIEEEQKKCFHYTNTQPLYKEENQRKNKYTY